ncbi:proline-rich membrane anchor 1-like [Denticeps clupeoides]|uniref:Proline rich membrane anchor 1 n=1 Tax=Denticeps clupeoides TaxID=299321 RepID=A0AAY4ARF2_9TELE|nr:proline-rich membrane anchor 1-like [Denticeps clupeoides]
MLVPDTAPFRLTFWPVFFGHCFFSLLLLVCEGELLRSCAQPGTVRGGEQCQRACQCRSYPPLPPPPPPPPPPRLPVAKSPLPLPRPWWGDFIVVATVGCVCSVFLLLTIIICYKAIKRKPLRKEENGTSRGEYAMTSLKKKTNNVAINNAVV